MDIEIRTIRPDEFEAYTLVLETAFGAHGRPEDVERERRVAEIDRCLGPSTAHIWSVGPPPSRSS